MLHSHCLTEGILLDFSFISEKGKDYFISIQDYFYWGPVCRFETPIWSPVIYWLISSISLPGEYMINSGSN